MEEANQTWDAFVDVSKQQATVLNSLFPKSDQHEFSSKNIITKGRALWS